MYPFFCILIGVWIANMNDIIKSNFSSNEPQHELEKISAGGDSEERNDNAFISQSSEDLGPGQLQTLKRIVTGRSTSSYVNPGPPPDGGIEAWTVAIMSRKRPNQLILLG
jgi:hypothetical protein